MVHTAGLLRRILSPVLSSSTIQFRAPKKGIKFYKLPLSKPPSTTNPEKPLEQKEPLSLDQKTDSPEPWGRPLKKIDLSLNRDPREKWGFVVYRLAYHDEAKWQAMLAKIRDAVEGSLAQMGRTDLLPRHELVIMDNQHEFEPMTVEQVHGHFMEWARRQVEGVPGRDSRAARYYVCLLVDSACLVSLQHPWGRPPLVKLLLGRQEFRHPDHKPKKLAGVTDGVNWSFIRVPRYVEFYEWFRRPEPGRFEYPQITSHLKAEATQIKKIYAAFS
ncbi:hypothetical protein V8F20_010251 [Naviculisporaceae sp. PSN 640]